MKEASMLVKPDPDSSLSHPQYSTSNDFYLPNVAGNGNISTSASNNFLTYWNAPVEQSQEQTQAPQQYSSAFYRTQVSVRANSSMLTFQQPQTGYYPTLPTDLQQQLPSSSGSGSNSSQITPVKRKSENCDTLANKKQPRARKSKINFLKKYYSNRIKFIE